MEKKISKSLFVEAREWFDKTGGNSYFSARISVDGETVGYLPLSYGYESQYQYSAVAWLIGAGYLEKAPVNIWDLKKLGIDVYTVKYSTNKKDAKRWGEIYK